MTKKCILVILLILLADIYGRNIAEHNIVFKKMVELINKKKYADLEKMYSNNFKRYFPISKAMPFYHNIYLQYGKIVKIQLKEQRSLYHVIYTTTYQRGKLDITLHLNSNNKIAGLLFLPYVPKIFSPKGNKTQLFLPFKNKWHVLWGGDTVDLNYHHRVPNQKYAFDFIIKNKNGLSYINNGIKNDNYYAFGKKIISPADGIITDVITGVKDNAPGSMNKFSALGNAIFIKHREYEYSIIAHLKYKSIKVKVGDKVKKGQLLGLCGNSGNSSEPHLHYHLQNTSIIQDGSGIRCVFNSVILHKKNKIEKRKKYSPVKGDSISSE